MSDDIGTEQIISRFAGSLSPPDRITFRRAAEDALAKLPCAGEGIVWRIVVGLWRGYFHPPSDRETGQPIGLQSKRPSKLVAGQPIDDPRTGGHDRRRLKLVS
jgi:hypothetical protein